MTYHEMTPHEYELYCLDALPEDEEGNRVYLVLQDDNGEIGSSQLDDAEIIPF